LTWLFRVRGSVPSADSSVVGAAPAESVRRMEPWMGMLAASARSAECGAAAVRLSGSEMFSESKPLARMASSPEQFA